MRDIDIVQIRELNDQEDVNDLLDDNWVLLDIKVVTSGNPTPMGPGGPGLNISSKLVYIMGVPKPTE